MRTIKRILIGSAIGLVAIGAGLALWFRRGPTTQLVDASGKALTAGTATQGEGASLGGSLFDEAQAMIKRKEFAAAKERLLRVIEESDRDGEACILLCDVSREIKDVDAAADYGLKAVELLPGSAEAHLSYPHDAPKVRIRVGSIHSVKGETHTAALVMETFWYDHNLENTAPWLTGAESGSTSAGKRQTTRLKLNYVAMTRPTHLVCLAMKRSSFEVGDGRLDQSLIGRLEDRGWCIKVI